MQITAMRVHKMYVKMLILTQEREKQVITKLMTGVAHKPVRLPSSNLSSLYEHHSVVFLDHAFINTDQYIYL